MERCKSSLLGAVNLPISVVVLQIIEMLNVGRSQSTVVVVPALATDNAPEVEEASLACGKAQEAAQDTISKSC